VGAVLKVVCLNWQNYLSRGNEYVGKLQRGVARNLAVPHEFVEVTEKDLPPGRKGWFNKLHLLEMFDGDVMYLDLDTIQTASLDHLIAVLASDRSKIWARDDWSYPISKPRYGREATINSSVMLWNGRKDMSGVTEKMLRETHGDQGIITQLFWHKKGIGLLPNESIQSYKYELRDKRQQPQAIVVCHGNPKPHEIKDEFVRQHWV
jgi:hypothetical protein